MRSDSLIGAEYYQLGWLIYIAAGIGLIVCFWQLIKLFKSPRIRRFLVSVMAIGIFTPTWQAGEESFIAPAILVAAFDFLDGIDKGLAAGVEIALKSLLPMILFVCISACYFIALKILQTQKVKSKEQQSK